MRRIKEIIDVESWTKDGKLHHRTHALVEKLDNPLDVEEVSGYGNDYDVGQFVEVFYSDKWNKASMQKGKP